MEHSIRILDKSGQQIGELIKATDTEILQYIAKGFVVTDRKTGAVITEADISGSLGISDGEMIMG